MIKPEPVTLFLSYAHEDESLRSELEKHLSLLQRQGLVSTWQDRRILAGTDWAQEIDEHLKSASIILLLTSSDFLASDYCYGIEMCYALERHKASRARVIPIFLRPVDWEQAPFTHLQGLPDDGKAVTEWDNRDTAFREIVQGIRRVIKELSLPSVNTSPTALPPVWNVPYPQNPLFTGREELLTQLATTLQGGQSTALSQPQAISGLGGIGKTQLALEYAYRYREDYQAVLWAQADTRENLTSSYLTIAALLNLPEKSEQESAHVITAMKNWLQRNTGWLLILDNADDLMLARDFLPPSVSGHVLITTRAQATGRFAHSLEVDILSTELGALLLLRRVGRLSPDAILEQAGAAEIASAKEICEELGGLPLALDQAGAYIEETGCDLVTYYQLYKHRRADLLAQRRGELVNDHPLSIATTWSLSFRSVEQKNPAAADLLRLCSFLAPDAIPEEIIIEGASYFGCVLGPVAADPLRLNEAIGELRRFSLIRRNPDTKFLRMHRLVQAVLQENMEKDAKNTWVKRAIRAVNRAFPEVEAVTWAQCERYLPQAQACETLIEQYNLAFPEAARLLHQAASYLDDRAYYVDAEILFKRALSMRERILGTDHPDTASSLNNLAILYSKQARYEQAEPLFQQILTVQERILGTDHFKVASSLNNLAVLYSKRGEDEQAERFFYRALSIRERILGTDHPDIANSLDNLAILYSKQARYEQAEPLFKRALSMRERVLGTDHPDTVNTLNSLAYLYSKRGENEQAELFLRRALTIAKKVLETEHPGEGIFADVMNYSPGPVVVQHLIHCQPSSTQSENPDQIELKLISKLYRWDCPSRQILGEYQSGLLSAELAASVEMHLSRCALCAADVSMPSEFSSSGPLLREAPSVLTSRYSAHRSSLNSYSLTLEAKRLLDTPYDQAIANVRRVNAVLHPPEIDFTYMRHSDSMPFWPCLYTAEDLSISMMFEPGDPLQLNGLVACNGAALEALCGIFVILSSQESGIYTQSINELGNFVFQSISPGTYTLELQLPESIVVINDLPVHLD